MPSRDGRKAATDYGRADAALRLSRFVVIGQLLTDDRGFGFRFRDTQTDRRMLENWVGILGWWMHMPDAIKPEPTDLRAWQRFVSAKLEFRLGVAIGAVVAQDWSAGPDNLLAIPSLESWRETSSLLWFGFWARELLRWGTLDPFVAFALAQGKATTRDAAVRLWIDFDAWLSQEIDRPTAEDHIDRSCFSVGNASCHVEYTTIWTKNPNPPV